jgi:TatD DNase family protein
MGEVGIDLSADGKGSRNQQELALTTLLETPGAVDKPLSLHSRDAVPEVVALLRAAKARRPILHSYGGTVDQVDDALDAGCSFSINPSMLENGEGRAVIAALPPDRVLVESDGPFRRVNDVPLEPADITRVHEHLGDVWKMSPAEAAAVTEDNMDLLLGR